MELLISDAISTEWNGEKIYICSRYFACTYNKFNGDGKPKVEDHQKALLACVEITEGSVIAVVPQLKNDGMYGKKASFYNWVLSPGAKYHIKF